MELETVKYCVSEGIAEIRLNRPEVLNAQNRQMVTDLLRALRAAEADAKVKAILLMGEGRAFCAGEDLSEEHDLSSIERGLQVVEDLQDVTRILLRMPKPAIAAVHGYALGAGCEWAMNCDIRIAATGTLFGFPETAVGMAVTNAGTKLLPLLVGLGRAKELVFTGEKFDAQKAERWGLVNRVVPAEKLEQAARAMAGQILANSTLAVALAKKSMNLGVYQGFEEVLANEKADIALIIQTLEVSLRIQAALAKTKGAGD
jgi:2-(1,2-epoxy-1,2-dihydrophenyl)acetyl-CoA isomerase